MSQVRAIAVSCTLVVLLLSLCSTDVHAQKDAEEIKLKINTSRIVGLGRAGEVKTPIYSANGQFGAAQREIWGHVQVEFATANPWIDQVSFKWYVLLYKRNAPAGKNYIMLSGEVTYIDVERDNKHLADMFILPSTIERYGDVHAFAVEVFAGGQRLDGLKEPEKIKGLGAAQQKFWTSPSLKSLDGRLMSRDKTPWKFIAIDDYETIK